MSSRALRLTVSLALTVGLLAAALGLAGSGGATFTARNGRIVFTRSHAVADAIEHDGIYSLDPASGHSRDLISGTAYVAITQVTPSPDGTQIAFLRTPPPPVSRLEWHLWLMGADGSDPHQLSDVDVTGSFAWSPDGTSIAFIAPASPTATIQRHDVLWVMNADGSGPRELTDVETAYPTWSPDGSEIAFVGRSAYGSPIGVVPASGTADSHWLSECGTPSQGCVTTSPPAWSPDGKAIVFARNDSLVVVGTAGSGERTLRPGGIANGYVGGCPLSLLCYAQVASLHWSPSDDEISFVDSAGNVEVIRPNGSSVQTIVCHAFTGAPVDWSPSGDRLAFERMLVNVKGPVLWELVVEPPHGAASILPSPSALGPGGLAGWLPSGGGLLYSAFGGVHSLELFSMRPGGGDPKQLTNNNLDDFDPVWSPDGRRIAFARGQVDVGYTAAERSLHPTSVAQSSLYLMNGDGSHVQRLTRSGIGTMPSWSPDGVHIVFARRHGAGSDLEIVDTHTRRIRALTPSASDPAWSPDGRLIAFASATKLRVIRPDRSGTRTLFRGGTSATKPGCNIFGCVEKGNVAQILRPAWSTDGRTIAFTLAAIRPDGSLAAQLLLTVSRQGGTPQPLPCRPATRWYYPDSDIPRIVSQAPDGSIGVSDGAAIWACTPTNASARFLRGGDEPDWQPLH